MPRLVVHRDAAEDLQQIRARGELADHGLLLAFLQQAKSDPALLMTLAEDWFGEDGTANHTVRKIVSLHGQGKRLWRVKVLSVKGLAASYRVLYAIGVTTQVFYVLGIPARGIAYDLSHPRIQRLIAVYDSLDIS